MKHIKVNKKTTKVPFCGDFVEVIHLSMGDLKNLKVSLDEVAKIEDKEKQGLASLVYVFRSTVIGCEEMVEADFEQFPISELLELSKIVTKINGMEEPNKEKLGN